MTALEDFVANPSNELGLIFCQYAEVAVGQRRGLFKQGKGLNYFDRHAALRSNFKVAARSLGLCAPVGCGWYVDFAHRVAFNAGICTHAVKLRPIASARNWLESLIFVRF